MKLIDLDEICNRGFSASLITNRKSKSRNYKWLINGRIRYGGLKIVRHNRSSNLYF